MPALPLRLAGGDLSRELMLGGQKVMPAVALASGFVFDHPHLAEALGAMLGERGALGTDALPIAAVGGLHRT